MAARREPKWLDRRVLVAAHSALLAEHGGAQGVRDAGLLDSALARPRNLLSYGNPDIFELAAAYAYGIARNHPFLDGNKRAAFLAAYIFLSRNGYTPEMSEAETVVMMNRLAARDLSESELTAWFARNTRVRRGRR
jgi:death-on-curing protein